MELKVLIIEDEPLAADKLKRQLHKIDPKIEVIATSPSIQSSLGMLKELKPDLIFSDIHLADGLSFQIFEQLKTDIPIIFITAYDQYAIQAFKSNSIDYLLKPVSKKSLEEALSKYQRLQPQALPSPIDFSTLRSAFEPKERFLVQSGGGRLISIQVEEIAYFFADGKHTFLVSREGKKYFSESNISKLQAELSPKLFFQVNRKFLIHIDSITGLFHYSKSRLKIELQPPPESEVIVSVERSPGFKKWLGK